MRERASERARERTRETRGVQGGSQGKCDRDRGSIGRARAERSPRSRAGVDLRSEASGQNTSSRPTVFASHPLLCAGCGELSVRAALAAASSVL
eukprot:3788716-Rhodomonas_salina.1